MSMTKEEERTAKQQEAFRADFEKRTGEKIASLELVSLEANPENLKALGLEYPTAQFCLWGLLVLCESRALYFYAHAHDFTIMGFKPTNSDDLSSKEQMVCLSKEPSQLTVSLPPHKTWLGKILAPNNVLQVNTASGAFCTLKTMKKAALLLERLSDYAVIS